MNPLRPLFGGRGVFYALGVEVEALPKIESIRPGDTLETTFSAYPLAELLMGILRGNLTGRLDVFLHPEPRNYLQFRHGVPVVVTLPDGGVSVVQVLIQEGVIPKQAGLDLLRTAEASGRNATEVLRQRGLLSQGELHHAEVRWARAQLVKLFDAGPVDFRFTEGVLPPEDGALTILQPLPVVYEGLRQSRDQAVVDRFLASHGESRFALSATYPRDVDPFEWGRQVEATLRTEKQALGMDVLKQAGLEVDEAAAVLAVLHMADMLDLREQGRTHASAPRPTPPPPVEESAGLVVHRRGANGQSVDANRLVVPEVAASPPTPPPTPEAPVGGNAHDREYVTVRDRLSPYFGQSYYQILRVTAETDSAQLDRAYRFLVRRFEEEMDRAGTPVVLDLIHEAYEVLRDPETSRRYALLVERGAKLSSMDRERRAFEAEAKVDRAVRAMGDGRTGEATLLLSWAERLDPQRTDLSAYFGVLDVIRAPDGQRAADARALRGLLQEQLTERSYDWRIKLCLGLVLAEDGDPWGANRLLESAPDRSHPMAVRISKLLGPLGLS